MSPHKNVEMNKYSRCTPSEWIEARFPSEKERVSSGNPFLVTDVLGVDKYPGYNLIQVVQPGGATIDRVDDEGLRSVLETWHGFIHPPPSYSLAAVPESTPEELKSPISGLLKWAAFQEGWVSVDRLINNMLGDLFESISQSGRATLKRKVGNILRDLSKGSLSGYLEYEIDRKRFMITIERDSEQSRKAFSGKINEWLNIVPIERFVDDEDLEEEE